MVWSHIEIVDGKYIGIDLPEQVVHEVIETESVVKGQTASSSYKPAILDNNTLWFLLISL